MSCVEGRDGSVPSYREHLLPPWWMWSVIALFVVSVAVAYGFALGSAAGVLAALIVGAAAAALLLATTVTVSVDECVVRAGRARLPLRYAGQVDVLDKQASARARTVEYDPGAHLVLRTWSSARAIRIAVTDPRDPHPYWLVTSGDPEALAQAIRSGADSARASGQSEPKRAG